MKKLTALLLALLLMASCCAFAEEPAEAANEKDAGVSGPWYGSLNSIPLTLTLGEDGSYTLHAAGMPEADSTGSWTRQGGTVILDEDEDLPFIILGDTLYCRALNLYLGRREKKTYTPVEILGAETSDATLFQGAWSSRYILLDDAVVPAEALLDDTIIYVEGSKVALTGDLFGEMIADFTYDGGAMQFSYQDLGVKLEMQQDLMMRMTVTFEGEDMTAVLFPYRTEMLTSSIEGNEAERSE